MPESEVGRAYIRIHADHSGLDRDFAEAGAKGERLASGLASKWKATLGGLDVSHIHDAAKAFRTGLASQSNALGQAMAGVKLPPIPVASLASAAVSKPTLTTTVGGAGPLTATSVFGKGLTIPARLDTATLTREHTAWTSGAAKRGVKLPINLDASKVHSQLDAIEGAIRTKTAGSGLGTIGGIALFAGAFVTAKHALSGFIERAEQAELRAFRLGTAFRASGGAAELSMQQMDDMTARIAQGTTFGRGDAKDAITGLLRYRSVRGDQFKKTLEIASDIASHQGTGLGDATEKIAWALERGADHGVGRLERMFQVVFPAEERQTFEALSRTIGDVTKSYSERAEAQVAAQELILTRLGKIAPGAALGLKGTNFGRARDLGKAMNEVRAMIGEQFASLDDIWHPAMYRMLDLILANKQMFVDLGNSAGNALAFIIDGVTQLIEHWRDMSPATRQLIGDVLAMAGAAGALFTLFKAAQFLGVGSAISMMLSPIGLAVVAFGALGYTLQDVIKWGQQLASWVESIGGSFGGFNAGTAAVIGAIGGIVLAIRLGLIPSLGQLVAAFKATEVATATGIVRTSAIRNGFSALAGAINPVTLALVGLGVLLARIAERAAITANRVNELTRSFEQSANAAKSHDNQTTAQIRNRQTSIGKVGDLQDEVELWKKRISGAKLSDEEEAKLNELKKRRLAAARHSGNKTVESPKDMNELEKMLQDPLKLHASAEKAMARKGDALAKQKEVLRAGEGPFGAFADPNRKDIGVWVKESTAYGLGVDAARGAEVGVTGRREGILGGEAHVYLSAELREKLRKKVDERVDATQAARNFSGIAATELQSLFNSIKQGNALSSPAREFSGSKPDDKGERVKVLGISALAKYIQEGIEKVGEVDMQKALVDNTAKAADAADKTEKAVRDAAGMIVGAISGIPALVLE